MRFPRASMLSQPVALIYQINGFQEPHLLHQKSSKQKNILNPKPYPNRINFPIRWKPPCCRPNAPKYCSEMPLQVLLCTSRTILQFEAPARARKTQVYQNSPKTDALLFGPSISENNCKKAISA